MFGMAKAWLYNRYRNSLFIDAVEVINYPLEILKILALFISATIAGALNAVAGGGSFITFPTLILTGMLSTNANATSTVALWPGTLASIGAYRKELTAQRRVLIPFSLISILGGLLGAILLLHTPPATFDKLIPFLMLFATLLFTFGGQVGRWFRSHLHRSSQDAGSTVDSMAVSGNPSPSRIMVVAVFQFATAVYGGFFGAGIGIVMLALLSILEIGTIHQMNALKVLLAAFINGVAVIAFARAGIIVWPQALLMLVGAVLGGYGGAYYARQLDPRTVRRFVIVVGFTLTIYFFLRQFFLPQ